MERTLEVITKQKSIPESALMLILSLTKIFLNVNFKTKKLILKVFMNNAFIRFFNKDANVIYLLIAFLAKISEQAVYNLTIGKALKYEFETTEFVANQTLQKILSVLLSPEIDKRLAADKTFSYNEGIVSLLNIKGLFSSQKFLENVDYVLTHIFSSVDALPEAKLVIHTSHENQHFSSLAGSLFEFLMKRNLIRQRIQPIPEEILPAILQQHQLHQQTHRCRIRVPLQQ